MNRGTVAEYLRGEFLKTFSEQRFDIERTVQVLSLSSESAVNERVRRRLLEYLDNLRQALDRSKPWEETREGLRPKTKNLPQRYHRYLEEVAEAYYRGMWDVPGDAGPL